MNRTKLYGFAIACLLGVIGISPVTIFAAETNTDTITMTEKNNDHKGKKAAFDEKLKKAGEKWNALTAKQKNEVYTLMENKMKEDNKLMDKLVELGVMEKVDADAVKAHMSEKYEKVKESGEFPLFGNKMRLRNK